MKPTMLPANIRAGVAGASDAMPSSTARGSASGFAHIARRARHGGTAACCLRKDQDPDLDAASAARISAAEFRSALAVERAGRFDSRRSRSSSSNRERVSFVGFVHKGVDPGFWRSLHKGTMRTVPPDPQGTFQLARAWTTAGGARYARFVSSPLRACIRHCGA
jgi:hypothetical protein